MAMKLPNMPRPHAYVGFMEFDFTAESAQELSAKSGEALSVVAYLGNWFIAKPVARLGEFGLVPASYVRLRFQDDPSKTMSDADVRRAIDSGYLPSGEVWRQAKMQYEQAGIGVKPPTSSTAAPHSNSAFAINKPCPPLPTELSDDADEHGSTDPEASACVDAKTRQEEEALPPGVPKSASILSFHEELGDYWFHLEVSYQPNLLARSNELPEPINMVLYRTYEDFRSFQLALLDRFPVEAGRQKRDPNDRSQPKDSDRIIPYMDGPVENVDEEVAQKRRKNLNRYIRKLVRLQHAPTDAIHVLRSDLVRAFLSPKPGDAVLIERGGEKMDPSRNLGNKDCSPSTAHSRPLSRVSAIGGASTLALDQEAERISITSVYSRDSARHSTFRNQEIVCAGIPYNMAPFGHLYFFSCDIAPSPIQ
jgi:bud emergence protein 1